MDPVLGSLLVTILVAIAVGCVLRLTPLTNTGTIVLLIITLVLLLLLLFNRL